MEMSTFIKGSAEKSSSHMKRKPCCNLPLYKIWLRRDHNSDYKTQNYQSLGRKQRREISAS